MLSDSPPSQSIRSFVLRQGRLTPGQKKAMQTLWPLFGIQANQAELRQHEWLNSTQALHMEIGFGMGHSLVQMAQQNPHICYFGIEVHSPGVGHILRQLHQLAISNVRIFHADVAQVLPLCPPACLDRVYLLFPDPWPPSELRLINRPSR